MTSYPGSFNDGRSAARRAVTVRLELSGLRILDDEGREIARWPYDELHLLDEDQSGRDLRLKCGDEGVARLTVADRRLLHELSQHARAPQATRAAKPRIGMVRALGLGAAGLAILVAVVWVALPRMAGWTAARIPVSWEEALGERVFEEMAELFSATQQEAPKFCETAAGRTALDRLTARLAGPAAAQVAAPYRFQVSVLDIEMAGDCRKAALSDSVEDTLNYKSVAKRLIAFVGESEFQLVETLAERCAGIIMDEFRVPWVKLRINKRGALRGARDVGVIIERGQKT